MVQAAVGGERGIGQTWVEGEVGGAGGWERRRHAAVRRAHRERVVSHGRLEARHGTGRCFFGDFPCLFRASISVFSWWLTSADGLRRRGYLQV